MAPQSADAVLVRLGGVDGQHQAQLDGFKTRVLRSEVAAQRHLYLTEWRSLDAAEPSHGATLVIGDAMLPAEYERVPSRVTQPELAAKLGGAWALIATAVATQRGSLARLPLFALEIALALVQTQSTTMPVPSVWLLTVGSPEHAGPWGLARSARMEESLPLVSMHTPVVTMALRLGPSLTEPEIALHECKSCAPRLKTAPPSSDGLVRLHFHARGAISNLFLEPLPSLPPLSDGMVLLRVRAVGLNFRDVLNVLGEYPGDPGPPGGDAAGMVASDHRWAGDAVFGLGAAPLASVARAPAQTSRQP